MKSLYVISGISGSGKTTIGSSVVKEFGPDFVFLDQDVFYTGKCDRVKLSNGADVKNWDTFTALDIERMKATVSDYLKTVNVVLVGFALPEDALPCKADVHVHLVTADNKRDLEDRCIKARKLSKPAVDHDNDVLTVKELVVPFYHGVVVDSDITDFVEVYCDGRHRLVEDLVQEVIGKFLGLYNKATFPSVQVAPEVYDYIVGKRKNVLLLVRNAHRWEELSADNYMYVYSSRENGKKLKIVKTRHYLPTLSSPMLSALMGEKNKSVVPYPESVKTPYSDYVENWDEAAAEKHGIVAIEWV